VITHICSTRIPYKTVGKEYIADRPEIEREIKNAAREALRRLGIFLSRKGSKDAVQRKINIYGKYLPLIAKFSTELAGKKRLPKYRKLIDEAEGTSPGQVQDGGPEEERDSTNEQVVTGAPNSTEMEIEQKKIDEYGGS
jgi:DNA topoisomerase VI subunit B